MNIAAFVLLSAIIGIYVLLDGYDLGVAAITPLVARTRAERGAAMASIGPFWNGNEVWLVVAGGVLFALFPKAYASAFSGFYLAFMVLLWLLMFRGIAIELRNHFDNEMWHSFWDTTFFASSAGLILLLGVALGNLLRGLPLNGNEYFPGTFAFLLNPYALGVGVFALLALAQHGMAFLAMRVDGPPAQRARRAQSVLWWMVLCGYLLVTLATFVVRTDSIHGIVWVTFVPLLSLASLVALRFSSTRTHERSAFIASSVFLASLMLAAAGTMFPYLLPAFPAGTGGLSIYATAPPAGALAITIGVTVIGLLLVIGYTTFVVREMASKITVRE
ncbi:MAG: cytochrome d ubiquinol oxidase subunit II [Vulcanimicrobiaceae bacterium]